MQVNESTGFVKSNSMLSFLVARLSANRRSSHRERLGFYLPQAMALQFEAL
jgi:hypothetical protein